MRKIKLNIILWTVCLSIFTLANANESNTNNIQTEIDASKNTPNKVEVDEVLKEVGVKTLPKNNNKIETQGETKLEKNTQELPLDLTLEFSKAIFNQDIFIACKDGTDDYVKIVNPVGSAKNFIGTNQIETLFKDTPFVNYECIQNGDITAPTKNTPSTMKISSIDSSVTIADGKNGTIIIPRNEVYKLFTNEGYDLNGKFIHWYLYEIETNLGLKQAIIHTSKRKDGTNNIDLFLSQ